MKKTTFFIIVMIMAGHTATLAQLTTTNLALWLDAAQGITQDGNKVTAWSDQSGNGNDLYQDTADYQPTLLSDIVNQLPAVSFDGNNDYLTGNVTVDGLTDMTMIVVSACNEPVTLNEWKNNASQLTWEETGSWGTVHFNATQDAIYARFGSGSDQTPSFGDTYINLGETAPGTTFTVTSASMQSGTTQLKLNGDIIYTGSQTQAIANTGSDMLVGRGDPKYDVDNNNFFPGYIAEILVYTGSLSSSNISTTENYLMDKYGIGTTSAISIQQENEPSFTVYPVPARDHLFVTNNTDDTQIYIQIINMAGQVVIDRHYEQQKIISVNVSELKQGMYSVCLYGQHSYKNQVITIK